VPVRIGQTSGTPITTTPGTFADLQAATAAATARLAAVNRGATTLHMTGPGNPRIASGSPLLLRSFRDGVDREYHAINVTHTLDAGGYKTTCSGISDH